MRLVKLSGAGVFKGSKEERASETQRLYRTMGTGDRVDKWFLGVLSGWHVYEAVDDRTESRGCGASLKCGEGLHTYNDARCITADWAGCITGPASSSRDIAGHLHEMSLADLSCVAISDPIGARLPAAHDTCPLLAR